MYFSFLAKKQLAFCGNGVNMISSNSINYVQLLQMRSESYV